MLDLTKLTPPTVLLAGAALLVVLALVLWRSGSRKRAADQDVFKLLGTSAKAARQRVAPSPVDLSQPIRGDADWQAIRTHARDAAYRQAVETVRNRYQIVTNPMLLSNTLKTTMNRWGLSFRDAVIRVAENDDLR
jgi:predicted permease